MWNNQDDCLEVEFASGIGIVLEHNFLLKGLTFSIPPNLNRSTKGRSPQLQHFLLFTGSATSSTFHLNHQHLPVATCEDINRSMRGSTSTTEPAFPSEFPEHLIFATSASGIWRRDQTSILQSDELQSSTGYLNPWITIAEIHGENCLRSVLLDLINTSP